MPLYTILLIFHCVRGDLYIQIYNINLLCILAHHSLGLSQLGAPSLIPQSVL